MEERVEEEEGGSASDEGGYQGWRWWRGVGGCVEEERLPSLALGNEADLHGASTREQTSLYLHSRKFPEHQGEVCLRSLFLERSKIPDGQSVAISAGPVQTVKLLIYGLVYTR